MTSVCSPRPPAGNSVHLALVAGVALCGALACDVTIKDGDVSVQHLGGHASQEWRREYPLSSPGRFEITSTRGPIEIVAGPAGHVAVAAVLTAASMTDERAAQLVRGSKIEETVAPDRVAIVTQFPREGGRVEAAFKVVVPADARVEATLSNDTVTIDGLTGHVKTMVVNGGIELRGLRGTVDAATVNGPVSVKMAEITGDVRVESTNGRIAIEVPKNARATLSARAVNGGIRATGLNSTEAAGRRIRSLESQLNGGGPEIDVRVTNGRITIEGK